MTVIKEQFSDFSFSAIARIAAAEGLKYQVGPFNICLKTNIPQFVDTFVKMYAPLTYLSEPCVFDFHTRVVRQRGIRGWFRPQAVFAVDSVKPFEPYPYTHAYPLAEWGLNWCIGLSAHQHVMLHSAVLEYKGKAIILPALPGSGKSTLCSALMLRGWRLLSDEFGLLEPESGQLIPIPRAIPLKNKSIEIIRDYDDNAILGPVFEGTRKGDVAHLAPTESSFKRQNEKVYPAFVVFPQYRPEIRCKLIAQDKSSAFTRITKNSFNYYLSGESGFKVLSRVIQDCDCYAIQYNSLDDAVDALTELLEASIPDDDKTPA